MLLSTEEITTLNLNLKIFSTRRTDQGVHGLKNSACVDLQFPCDVDSQNIHSFVNRFFIDTELEVR